VETIPTHMVDLNPAGAIDYIPSGSHDDEIIT